MDKHLKWFLVGMSLYIFPPDPEVGDIKALHKWKPKDLGFWEALKFRFKFKIFRYSAKSL